MYPSGDGALTHSTGNAMFSRESSEVLVRIRVILLEFLNDILANIGIILLDLLGSGDNQHPARAIHVITYTLN